MGLVTGTCLCRRADCEHDFSYRHNRETNNTTATVFSHKQNISFYQYKLADFPLIFYAGNYVVSFFVQKYYAADSHSTLVCSCTACRCIYVAAPIGRNPPQKFCTLCTVTAYIKDRYRRTFFYCIKYCFNLRYCTVYLLRVLSEKKNIRLYNSQKTGFIVFYNYATLRCMSSIITFLQNCIAFLKEENNRIVSTKIWHIVQFIFVLFIIFLCFKILKTIVKKITQKKCSVQIQFIIDKGIRYTGFTVMVMTVFHRLGIDISAILGAAGIAGVAIGFASQTSISNVISGLFVITERAFKINDIIEVNGTMGTVQSINLLSVSLKTFDNQYVRIPNESIIKANLINYSQFPYRRVKTELSVAYGTDLRKVEQILLAVAKKNAFVIEEPAPSILWTSFADSGINLTLMAWTKIENFGKLRNSLFIEIDEKLKEENIEVPFPQLDVHIKDTQASTTQES